MFSQLLRNRQLCALWLAQLISSFGDWLATMGLFSLVAFRLQAPPYQISWIMIAFLLPAAIIGPVAGVFIDHWNLKKTMIVSDVIRAILVLSFALPLSIYQIALLMLCLSLVSVFFTPAQTVALRLLVQKEELLAANAISTQLLQINRILSPAIAGLLVGLYGEKVCFYIDSASFLLSAILLSGLVLRREPQPADQQRGSTFGEWKEGLRFIAKQRTILFLITSMILGVFAFGAYDSLLVAFIRDDLNAGSRLFGMITSLSGVGVIIGGLFIGKARSGGKMLAVVCFGIAGVGASIFVMALFSRVTPAVICSLLLGVALAHALIPAQALLQGETPQSMLGRVSSTANSLTTISQIAAFLLGGLIGSWVGVRNLYYLVGLGLVLVGLIGLAFVKVTKLGEAAATVTEASKSAP
jgi:MFS family permease